MVMFMNKLHLYFFWSIKMECDILIAWGVYKLIVYAMLYSLPLPLELCL